MKRYLDMRLALFALLALLSSIISAHGALVFFGYLVDPWLAVVFTVVIALGIIGLDAAATLERHASKRAAYIGGMALFLGMEVLANYFAGQASFVSKVREALIEKSPNADLLVITAEYPTVTRVLVVLFLSLASIAVAAFVFAASLRVAQIRSGATTALADRLRRMLARRRRWYANAARELCKVRKQAAQWVADLEAEREQSARLRERYVRLRTVLDSRRTLVRTLIQEVRAGRKEIAGLSADLHAISATAEKADTELLAKSAEWSEQSARLTDQVRMSEAKSAEQAEQVRSEQEKAARLSAQLRKAEDETERLRQQLTVKSADVARLSEALDTQSAIATLDTRSIAQQLREDGVALRTIAAALNVSEKTIRNWTTDVRTNGNHKEVIL